MKVTVNDIHDENIRDVCKTLLITLLDWNVRI